MVVQDEEQLGKDFVSSMPFYVSFILKSRQMGFLCNLVKVFPSLAKRPLHLTGESYAGQYIVCFLIKPSKCGSLALSQPYILKAYFDLKNPPVKIAKIAIGDGTYTSGQVFEILPAVAPSILSNPLTLTCVLAHSASNLPSNNRI